MILNIKLKNKRNQMGLTQMEIAQKSQITERSYQRIERGAQEPKVSTAKLIAQILDSTVEELF